MISVHEAPVRLLVQYIMCDHIGIELRIIWATHRKINQPTPHSIWSASRAPLQPFMISRQNLSFRVLSIIAISYLPIVRCMCYISRSGDVQGFLSSRKAWTQKKTVGDADAKIDLIRLVASLNRRAGQNYPLVITIFNGKITIFNGKIHYVYGHFQ